MKKSHISQLDLTISRLHQESNFIDKFLTITKNFKPPIWTKYVEIINRTFSENNIYSNKELLQN